MLDTLRKWLAGAADTAQRDEQQVLRHSMAALLHEMTRVDMQVRPEDVEHARNALIDLLGIDTYGADALLANAAQASNRLTSYHEAVSALNRALSMEQKVRFVEHLWRVAHADDALDMNEDHLVRKLADLLYVPHIETMLARQRARAGRGRP
jgi:uncharacterized tellurite resistance protein B-like protein